MNSEKIITALKIIAIPTIYALVLRVFFGVNTWRDIFNMMSGTFLFLSPLIVGALTVYFSPRKRVERLEYRITAPFIPIFAFYVITFFLLSKGYHV